MIRSNRKRKVLVVIINRANYARIKAVLAAMKKRKDLNMKIVVGASMLLSRYGEAKNIVMADGFHIDHEIRITLEGESPVTMAKSTGLGLLELSTLFENEKPDVVVTIADRYETLATAIAASYMNIPLAHTQGGETSGSIDHSVRNAITKLSHIHLVTNKQCADRVLGMGEDKKRIFITGCPSMDVAKEVGKNPDTYLKEYVKKYKHKLPDTNNPFLVVLHHPVTTEYKNAASQIRETMMAIKELKIPAVVFYPNVDAGSYLMVREIQHLGIENLPNFYFYRNMPPDVFLALLKKSACIVGNSSAGIRESSFYGIPSVTIGTRQKTRDRAENVIQVGYDRAAIKKAIQKQLTHGKYERSALYGEGAAGKRIAEILATCELNIVK